MSRLTFEGEGFHRSTKFGGCWLRESARGLATVLAPANTRSGKFEASYRTGDRETVFRPSTEGGVLEQIRQYEAGKL